MYTIYAKNMELKIDTHEGALFSFKLGNRLCCSESTPVFKCKLRDKNGGPVFFDSTGANNITLSDGNILLFTKFREPFQNINVKVSILGGDNISFGIQVKGIPDEYALEWVEFPRVSMPRLKDNDPKGGKIVFPYNEGILLTDESCLPRYEPDFPMSGSHFIFPNMICSQFIGYLFDEIGLYIGAHDPKRGFKGIDFYPQGRGISMHIRLYSGVGYGDDYTCDYPIVWQACRPHWKDAACIYRDWLEKNPPCNILPIDKNLSLPKWYNDPPLIVTYPVRGMHDMDKMEPNALFPYTNALPIIDKIKADTGCRIMALLMHWEGTAPWAPPYVWPPFGGEDCFNEFKNALHKNGDLLGVYCSGFGYTLQSTLIEEYNCEERIKAENVLSGVCHSPANKPEKGITCSPYQRYGYDICPVSKRGREILDEAYDPLLKSDINYIQILDQNHGGGQYMCFARDHGHPPMPGEWMTSNMQSLLKDWSTSAPHMLFGCEGAASEPFIGNLLMSDNRFELNYPYGTPIPLYAFLYHEYVRNFMGNQCGCPFEPAYDTLRYRLAYSFSIGDIMTLVLNPNGGLLTHWSTNDFEHCPDMEKTLIFVRNATRLYNTGARKYLCSGKMSTAPDIECDTITIPLSRGRDKAELPRLPFSCWEADDGRTAYIVMNPEDEPVNFLINGKGYIAPPLDGIIVII